MKRVFSRCLVPAAILGILCTPLAAMAMPIVGTFSDSDLTDDGFVDFDVNISGTSNVTDVSLLVNTLLSPESESNPTGVPDYLNQTEAYLMFNGETLLLWQGLTGANMLLTNFTDSALASIDSAGSEPYFDSFQAQGASQK
jgi:hypothetical protein